MTPKKPKLYWLESTDEFDKEWTKLNGSETYTLSKARTHLQKCRELAKVYEQVVQRVYRIAYCHVTHLEE